ncbi:hypothetical protein NQ315_017021, partial [Exocentrus adspersus]
DSVLYCYCEGQCPSGDENGICQVEHGGKCFTTLETVKDDTDESDDYLLLSYGCFGPKQVGLLQCKGVPHSKNKSIQCCDSQDFCNKDLFAVYYDPDPPNLHSPSSNTTFIVLLVSFIVCCLAVILSATICVLYRRNSKKSHNNNNLEANNQCHSNGLIEEHAESEEVHDMSSCTSGSGLPRMVQRTIAKQIQLGASIGKGRFGEVWLGTWREEEVAVKVFISTEEKSWFREMQIYQTAMMRHDNILGYIAADIRGDENWTQLLLITEYHEHGSLYDFLQTRTVNPHTLLVMCKSIARGLTHLHAEILGTNRKPSIAHRDLKSKNILVKSNGECCLADFGLAVKYDSNAGKLDYSAAERTGTKRYMAPEILDAKINLNSIDEHKLADMYACGLVFWEITRRCEIGSFPALAYAVPFQEHVSNDPSFEEMQEVVCVNKVRPTVPEHWKDEEILQAVSKTIQELWHDNPGARLSALRVKKTLYKIIPVKDVTVDID